MNGNRPLCGFSSTTIWIILALLLMTNGLACDRDQQAGLAPDGPVVEIWPDSLRWQEPEPFPFPQGIWKWRLLDAAGCDLADGAILKTAVLGRTFHWEWKFPPPSPGLPVANLVPLDSEVWHSLDFDPSRYQTVCLFPLPRQKVDSPYFPHLLSLVKELTRPWFDQVVTHWPEIPIPVRLGSAVCGLVDLSACLGEAVAIWNEDPERPWFRIDESSAWGIRLIHFPDISLSPPLEARITRLDDQGRPLRVNIVAGNNYEQLREPKYVVRGFVHELGHGLFLWGHSPDREHCLWGAAPPLVIRPSEDERKAARLWHGLPEGLDLSRYH